MMMFARLLATMRGDRIVFGCRSTGVNFGLFFSVFPFFLVLFYFRVVSFFAPIFFLLQCFDFSLPTCRYSGNGNSLLSKMHLVLRLDIQSSSPHRCDVSHRTELSHLLST